MVFIVDRDKECMAAALVLAPLEKVIQQTADYCRHRKVPVRIVDSDKECMAAAYCRQRKVCIVDRDKECMAAAYCRQRKVGIVSRDKDCMAAALVLARLEKFIQQTADYCRQRKVRIVDRDKECMAAEFCKKRKVHYYIRQGNHPLCKGGGTTRELGNRRGDYDGDGMKGIIGLAELGK